MAGDVGTAASGTQAGRCVNFTGTREQAAGKRIGEVVVRRPKSLPVDATVGDVRRTLENPSLRNVVLLDGTAFAGLVDRGGGARRRARQRGRPRVRRPRRPDDDHGRARPRRPGRDGRQPAEPPRRPRRRRAHIRWPGLPRPHQRGLLRRLTPVVPVSGRSMVICTPPHAWPACGRRPNPADVRKMHTCVSMQLPASHQCRQRLPQAPSLALPCPANGSNGSARDRPVHAVRPVAAVKAMVCVHHAGSAHQARNASIDRSSSLPEATRRARSSLTVSRQYTAQAEPPL